MLKVAQIGRGYFIIGFLLLFFVVDASAEKRIALVIGNSQYANLSPLNNPRNDAVAVAKSLKELGFTLFKPLQKDQDAQLNLGLRQLLRAKNAFARASKDADIALIYYAGHGVQLDGHATIVPVDVSKPNDDVDLELLGRESMRLKSLLNAVGDGPKLRVAIFDACREVPELKKMRGGAFNSGWRGLSRAQIAKRTIVAYSTEDGRLAADGRGKHSPYTRKLLKVLNENPEQEIGDFFRDVATQIESENGQQPEVSIKSVPPRRWSLVGRYQAKAITTAKAESTPEPDYGKLTINVVPADAKIRILNIANTYKRGMKLEKDKSYDIYVSREKYKSHRESVLLSKSHQVLGVVLRKDATVSPTIQGDPQQVITSKVEPTSVNQPTKPERGSLTIKVEPSDALVRIMNIGPKYQDGILLEKGQKYDVYVSREGYKSYRKLVHLTKDTQVEQVILASTGNPKPVRPERILENVNTKKLGLYKSCYDRNLASSCYQLGVNYEYGKGVNGDSEKAVALYRKACDAGSMKGCTNLGYAYKRGNGIVQSYVKSVELYRKSCEGGEALGCANLGNAYLRGNGVKKDYKKSIELYRKACDGGNAQGCTNLGVAYKTGNSLEQDYKKSAELYRKGCDGGNAQGCNNLGSAFSKGNGVKKDYKKAVEFFRKACDGDNASGCSNLGVMYTNGRGIKRNDEKSVELYRKGCDAGSDVACNNLGYAYETGKGVKKDYRKSRALYQQACDSGYNRACNNLKN